ncbi:riboflavin kinase (NB-ARC domain protein) [Apiospora arundinis]|uniref:Riboflavin kinase n=1 Tax=Apiospora arundinis TaxID=335852 RepID=A0ABR2HQ78_9PEZI
MSATPSIMVPGGIRRKPVPEAQKRPPSPEVYDLLDDYYSEGDSNPPPYSLVEQPREDPRYNVQHRDNVRYQAQDREDSRYQDRPRPPAKAATIPLVIPTVNHFPPPPPPPQASPTPTPTWPPAGSPHSNAATTTVHYFPPPPPSGPPTPTSAWTPTGQTLHSKASTNSLRAQSDYGFPPPPPPPGPPTPGSAWTPTSHTLHSKTSTNSLRTPSDYGFPPPPPPMGNTLHSKASTSSLRLPSEHEFPAPPTPTSADSTPTTSGGKSFWQTAVDETIYFAGGLVSNPSESTKHYTIMRNSSALVYYRGPSTSVTITIFSDSPLPEDRTLWLQRKGFSGDMGMNFSTMFRAGSNWIDVTPTTEALPSDLPATDERAWQRDTQKFYKKSSKDKHLAKQMARETCVVRIPAIASDGYLRLLMCTGEGKKVLCPSPVFRVASTSSDVSVMRGASLSTMPLEMGLKAASVVGNAVVNKYMGPAKMLVGDRVQKVTKKVTNHGFVTSKAEHIAYAKSGLKDKFNSLEQGYDGARDVSYAPLHEQILFDHTAEVLGSDTGPESPFPIKLNGRVTQGTGQGQAQMGIPTANLTGVSSDLLLRLSGIYIGWACVQPGVGHVGVSYDWQESIIMIGPSPYAAPRIVSSNVATVHMIHDFGSATFFNSSLKVIIMAYLRPAPTINRTRSPEELQSSISRDIDIALASLSRDAWGPHETIRTLKTAKSERNLADKYVEKRVLLQKRVDSVPLHWAGVRSAGAEARDQAHGRGGLYIKR